MNGLPPLTDAERARVRAEFATWYATHAGPGYDRTDGEATWEWAYYHYARTPYKGPINRPCSACSAGDTKMEYHNHDYVQVGERRTAK